MTIRVEDNGQGVPASIRDTMFEPFVSSGKHNGTGLGLTLAHRIAQEHGGSVVLEQSIAGKTVFAMHLAKSRLRAFADGITEERAAGATPRL